MSSKRKLLYYCAAIGVLIIFALILLSSILDVGLKLREISKYVEISFYVLTVLVVYFLIINPIRIIIFSPSFSLASSIEENKRKNYPVYKKVAKNLIMSNNLDESDVKLLQNYKGYDELKENLSTVFEKTVVKQMNKVIVKHAKTVFLSTAISQNARVDMLSTFCINLKMIKELVSMCGFRPSFPNLAKLTINVFSTALIAEGLENINIEDVMPASTLNGFSDVPLIKPIISSITQGTTNCLLTVRIGTVTRKYLFADGAEVTKEQIRRNAYKESAKIVPMILADTITFFPKKVVSLFKKKPQEQPL